MFKFFKKSKKDKTLTSETKAPEIEASHVTLPEVEITHIQPHDENARAVNVTAPKKKSWFTKIRESLSKTRHHFVSRLRNLLSKSSVIDEDFLEELETILLQADIGVAVTEDILDALSKQSKVETLKSPDAISEALKTILISLLGEPTNTPVGAYRPHLILMIGVNGSGKTTTIGKLTRLFQTTGYSVCLAAGDTFRAAAIEQLEAWGERNNTSVISQHQGADSASVVFDAYQSAKAKNIDIVIADTAGRLHTQTHLMDELEKVARVVKKIEPNAPHETLLVLDASLGQNAIAQAKAFHATVPISGIVLTKLDGSSKGGFIFSITKELGLPVFYIGVGEGIDDLKSFNAQEFVDALFDDTHDD